MRFELHFRRISQTENFDTLYQSVLWHKVFLEIVVYSLFNRNIKLRLLFLTLFFFFSSMSFDSLNRNNFIREKFQIAIFKLRERKKALPVFPVDIALRNGET